MRILFVDDEARVLSGIDNALVFADYDWEADFAASGEEAVAHLSANTYEVVVTDMKMPGMTGADVLEHVINTCPKTLRIILSGEVDATLADRAMPLSHEFVSKPCDPEDLFQIIDRVFQASQSLRDGTARDALGSLDRLPAQPALHQMIQEAIQQGDGADSIARLIESDLAIASTIIKTANSAFYGFRTPADNVKEAVVRLGNQTVTGIVLNAEIGSWVTPQMERMVVGLNARSALIADIVRKMVGSQVSQAPLAGLLHDIGVLLLLSQFPEEYQALRDSVEDTDLIEEAEREMFGASHAEIGAYMLRMWNADPVVVEATRHHHGHDGEISDDARRIIDAIAAADLAQSSDAEIPPGLDPELVDRARELMTVAEERMQAT
jgi:putative nucleotidyltransferase with HDIG domain